MNKKPLESKKWLCFIITAIFLFVLAAFALWQGLGWEAVAFGTLFTLIAMALIIGQAFVDRVLYRSGQIAAALKAGKEPEEE